MKTALLPMNNADKSPDVHDHMLQTYTALRRALFIAGLGLPLTLLVGSLILRMPVQDSMSQYYHAGAKFRPTEEQRAILIDAKDIKDALARAKRRPNPDELHTLNQAQALDEKLFSAPGTGEMRDWFVGGLFFVGILLIVYKGFLRDENIALNFAGLFAMGVALFHMPWGDHHRSWVDEALKPLFDSLPWEQHVPSVHYICALMLFLCLGYVCLFCGKATLNLPGDPGPDGKGRSLSEREKTCLLWSYRGFGAIMVIAPVVGVFLSHIPGIGFQHAVFIVETIGVLGFAGYWFLKSHELHKTGADRLVAKGEVEIVRSNKFFEGHTLRKVERPIEELPRTDGSIQGSVATKSTTRYHEAWQGDPSPRKKSVLIAEGPRFQP